MKAVAKNKLEKFSNFEDVAAELRLIESKNIQTKHAGTLALENARSEVLSAVEGAHRSRYELGMALEAYRAFFKAERGWMEAAKIIAVNLQRDPRTVRNIITDYHGLKALPKSIVEAAHSRGIDLAMKRYQPVVKAIEGAVNSRMDVDDEEAREIIDKVIQMPKQKQSIEDAFLPLTKDENARWKIRMKIRTALNNIDTPRKLPELIAALEEEMFAVWNQAEPITITITPRQSPLTLDGRKRKG